MGKLACRTCGRDSSLFFIAGGDSLVEVSTWRESEKLLTSYNFIFVTRPGVAPIDPASVLPARAIPSVRNLVGLGPRRLRHRIQIETAAGESRVFIVDMGALDISASEIRELASRGKQIGHLVSAPVYEYLQKTRLYGEP
jgi:nicotinic acid mononucleotide adenylyltransferase